MSSSLISIQVQVCCHQYFYSTKIFLQRKSFFLDLLNKVSWTWNANNSKNTIFLCAIPIFCIQMKETMSISWYFPSFDGSNSIWSWLCLVLKCVTKAGKWWVVLYKTWVEHGRRKHYTTNTSCNDGKKSRNHSSLMWFNHVSCLVVQWELRWARIKLTFWTCLCSAQLDSERKENKADIENKFSTPNMSTPKATFLGVWVLFWWVFAHHIKEDKILRKRRCCWRRPFCRWTLCGKEADFGGTLVWFGQQMWMDWVVEGFGWDVVGCGSQSTVGKRTRIQSKFLVDEEQKTTSHVMKRAGKLCWLATKGEGEGTCPVKCLRFRFLFQCKKKAIFSQWET